MFDHPILFCVGIISVLMLGSWISLHYRFLGGALLAAVSTIICFSLLQNNSNHHGAPMGANSMSMGTYHIIGTAISDSDTVYAFISPDSLRKIIAVAVPKSQWQLTGGKIAYVYRMVTSGGNLTVVSGSPPR